MVHDPGGQTAGVLPLMDVLGGVAQGAGRGFRVAEVFNGSDGCAARFALAALCLVAGRTLAGERGACRAASATAAAGHRRGVSHNVAVILTSGGR